MATTNKIKTRTKTTAPVPANIKDKALYARIKASIKRRIDANGQRWGAYTSGELVRKYKQAYAKKHGKGVGYVGKKKKNAGLSRWFGEKWIDVCKLPRHVPCGRNKAAGLSYAQFKKKFPYCRPSVKISASTPRLATSLSAAQKKSLCAKKKKNPLRILR